MNNENTSGLQSEQGHEKESKTYRVPVIFQMEVEFEVEASSASDAISKASQWDNCFKCFETDGWCKVGEYYNSDNNCLRDENEMHWEIRDIEFSSREQAVELED